MMKKTPGVALAIDDFCAIAFVDGTYNVITSKMVLVPIKSIGDGARFIMNKLCLLTKLGKLINF